MAIIPAVAVVIIILVIVAFVKIVAFIKWHLEQFVSWIKKRGDQIFLPED